MGATDDGRLVDSHERRRCAMLRSSAAIRSAGASQSGGDMQCRCFAVRQRYGRLRLREPLKYMEVDYNEEKLQD